MQTDLSCTQKEKSMSTEPTETASNAGQRETVAISLTKGQWFAVMQWLTYVIDWNIAQVTLWETFCSDQKLAAETAASYEKQALEAEAVKQIIENEITTPVEWWENNNASENGEKVIDIKNCLT